MFDYVNGKIVKEKDAKISVFDSGFLYGDGAFTTMVSTNKKIHFLKEHIDRLIESCEMIKIKSPLSKKQLITLTEKLFLKNKKAKTRISIIITRGGNSKQTTVAPEKNNKASLVIIFNNLKFPDKKIYEKGIKITTSIQSRFMPVSKSLNFLASIITHMDAEKKNFDNCLLVSEKGLIKEMSSANIFIVKKGAIKTPKDDILLGITRKKVIELAIKHNFKVKEAKIKLNELNWADEVFITGTTKKIIPVVKVNKKIIGNGKPGKTTKYLLKEFEKTFNY